MEFDYQKAWKQIFGLNSEKVEVLEALGASNATLRVSP
jgi:hypothetical protein